MAQLPISVVCYRCLTRFNTGIRLNEGVTGTMVRGTRARCPTCRSLAKIPDGEYSFEQLAREAWERSSEPERQQIAAILAKVGTGRYEPVEVVNEIEQVGGKWATIGQFLKPESGADLLAYLALLFEVIRGIAGF